VVDEAGGAGLRTLVDGKLLIGLELLITGALGRGAAEVVGAVLIWMITGGGSGAVVVGAVDLTWVLSTGAADGGGNEVGCSGADAPVGTGVDALTAAGTT